jgi:hypothetical protein
MKDNKILTKEQICEWNKIRTRSWGVTFDKKGSLIGIIIGADGDGVITIEADDRFTPISLADNLENIVKMLRDKNSSVS